jgi:hypothetical protein
MNDPHVCSYQVRSGIGLYATIRICGKTGKSVKQDARGFWRCCRHSEKAVVKIRMRMREMRKARQNG